MSELEIIQGSDRILQSAALVITRESAPLLLRHGGHELLIEADLDEPWTRPDGTIMKPVYGPDAVTPADTAANPKVRTLGDARVEYSITPTGEPKGEAADATGRVVHLSYVLSFKVLTPSAGRTTERRPRFDWVGAPTKMFIPSMAPIVDPNLMPWEERQAYLRKMAGPFFAPPKTFKRSHEAG